MKRKRRDLPGTASEGASGAGKHMRAVASAMAPTGKERKAVKITVPAEAGNEPLDCPHQYVGQCEPCRTAFIPETAGPRPRRKH